MVAGTAESSHCDPQASETMGIVGVSKTSVPSPSDTPAPTRPHLLILPEQFHQLELKYPNLQACVAILIQIPTVFSVGCQMPCRVLQMCPL